MCIIIFLLTLDYSGDKIYNFIFVMLQINNQIINAEHSTLSYRWLYLGWIKHLMAVGDLADDDYV